MTCAPVDTDTLCTDDMHVVCARAAGLDVHKMQITATVRLCEAGSRPARTATREFSALPDGLRAMTDWLRGHGVTAAAMEGTGVYWKTPFEALEDAGIDAALFNAQHVKQIRGKKTDANDSLWLARICQFGLALPSYVPPRLFRQLRQLTRYRRKLVTERNRTRNRVHKTLDHDGLRLGGVLTDIFGVNGRRILDGLVAGLSPQRILTSLTHHVAAKLAPLAQALAATLDPRALFRLQIQIEAADRADAVLAALDARIQTTLADAGPRPTGRPGRSRGRRWPWRHRTGAAWRGRCQRSRWRRETARAATFQIHGAVADDDLTGHGVEAAPLRLAMDTLGEGGRLRVGVAAGRALDRGVVADRPAVAHGPARFVAPFGRPHGGQLDLAGLGPTVGLLASAAFDLGGAHRHAPARRCRPAPGTSSARGWERFLPQRVRRRRPHVPGLRHSARPAWSRRAPRPVPTAGRWPRRS